MSINVFAYTVYRKENPSLQIFAKGLFTSREKAQIMMNHLAESYCIDKVGANNFILNQLENPDLKNTIRDGIVLYKENGYEIRIVKRIANYVPFQLYTEYELCRFGLLPIIQEKIVINTMGDKEIVDITEDYIKKIDVNSKPEICNKTEVKNRIIKMTNKNIPVYETMMKELVQVMKKRNDLHELAQDNIRKKDIMEKVKNEILNKRNDL